MYNVYCILGHITISIAKNFNPLKAVGIDIDKKLIQIANKNIKHYLDTRWVKGQRWLFRIFIAFVFYI